MDYDEEVVAFLTRPDNLRHAFEVAEHLEAVKDRLLLKFYRTLELRLRTRLEDQSAWIVAGDSCEKLVQPYGTLRIAPSASVAARHLEYWVQHDQPAGNRVYYGLCWGEEVTTTPSLDEFSSLEKTLAKASPGYKTSRWWAAYQLTDVWLRDKQTAIHLARDDSRERGLEAVLMDLFEATHEQVATLNDALARTVPPTALREAGVTPTGGAAAPSEVEVPILLSLSRRPRSDA